MKLACLAVLTINATCLGQVTGSVSPGYGSVAYATHGGVKPVTQPPMGEAGEATSSGSEIARPGPKNQIRGQDPAHEGRSPVTRLERPCHWEAFSTQDLDAHRTTKATSAMPLNARRVQKGELAHV